LFPFAFWLATANTACHLSTHVDISGPPTIEACLNLAEVCVCLLHATRRGSTLHSTNWGAPKAHPGVIGQDPLFDRGPHCGKLSTVPGCAGQHASNQQELLGRPSILRMKPPPCMPHLGLSTFFIPWPPTCTLLNQPGNTPAPHTPHMRCCCSTNAAQPLCTVCARGTVSIACPKSAGSRLHWPHTQEACIQCLSKVTAVMGSWLHHPLGPVATQPTVVGSASRVDQLPSSS
jgi:hypothetical protein